MIINIIMIVLSIYLLCGFIGYGIMAKNVYNPAKNFIYGLKPYKQVTSEFKIAFLFICTIGGFFTLHQSLYNKNFYGLRFW